MREFYVDSSVFLYAIFPTAFSEKLQEWFDTPGNRFMSSRLMRTEVMRALRRDDLEGDLIEPLLDEFYLVPINAKIHEIAESFVPNIKTLDALHLATAMYLDHGLTIVTHDENMKKVAKLQGMKVYDPILERTDGE
ncbi:MAG: type II toxin-antitoxin system VapC family toxin [Microbacteriaceae bacterium]|nr:type II toxin-antitoxin system VapC family toxin [Microbacteriaceae bacterium]